MSARVLIAGCGYVGSELARRLVTDGHEVFALRRSRPSAPIDGVTFVQADLRDAGSLAALPVNVDVLFYTAAPDVSSEDAYRAAYVHGLRNTVAALGRTGGPKRVILTTSTAVYGQDAGEEVDERSPAMPARFQGRVLLEAEHAARQASERAIAVRFGGIYGPGRNRLIDQVLRGEATAPAAPSYTNRIHRDDCAGVLRHVARLERPEPVYLGVDCDPADRREVLEWLARRLGAPEPRTEPAERATGKRCRNRRLVASGYAFEYPTFREGYEHVLAKGEDRPASR